MVTSLNMSGMFTDSRRFVHEIQGLSSLQNQDGSNGTE